jgi:serine/threonine protein phosphatase PrpC
VHCAVRGVFVDYAELSHAGHEPTKQINEDTCALAQTSHGLLAVTCDGMGGHSAGREASTTAMRTVVEYLSRKDSDAEPAAALKNAVEAAARDVYAVGGDAPPELRPGSTCVATLLHDGLAEIAHVGDSRAYLFRGGELTRLTRDHSMVQQMVDAGVLSPEDAVDHPDANKITRALGMMETADVELRAESLRLVTGDVLLLCTDGLTDMVEDPDLTMLIGSHVEKGPEHLAKVLVEVALARGGWDNVTVQVLVVRELGKREPATVLLDDADEDGADGKNTVVDSGTAQKTWVDAPGAIRPAPSPTLMEEPAVERTTLPGGPGSPLTRFTEDAPADVPRRSAAPARALVWYAAVITAVIVVGVIAWAVARKVRTTKEEEVLPPPAAEHSAPAAPVIPPPTELSAEPEVPEAPKIAPDAPAPDAALP